MRPLSKYSKRHLTDEEVIQLIHRSSHRKHLSGPYWVNADIWTQRYRKLYFKHEVTSLSFLNYLQVLTTGDWCYLYQPRWEVPVIRLHKHRLKGVFENKPPIDLDYLVQLVLTRAQFEGDIPRAERFAAQAEAIKVSQQVINNRKAPYDNR